MIMAAGKEILSKIRSVQSTQKITRAMQMVATSKMRKTQERMRQARPYADKIRNVMAHLAQAHGDIAHPFLDKRSDIQRVGLILVTSDKGLCGGLNVNVLKNFYQKVRSLHEEDVDIEVCCLGQKGLQAAQRVHLNVVSSATHLGDIPKMERLIGPAGVLFDRYAQGNLDAVYIVYSQFINTMKQQAYIKTLLPLSDDILVDEEGSASYAWEYTYEPNPSDVMATLLQRYLESMVFHAVAENMAAEQAARMMAMKSATDNAGSVIKELRLIYNKSRQAAITKELSEIVAGAAAV
jgi:F-type H+-transporting ATPase subunit gamma